MIQCETCTSWFHYQCCGLTGLDSLIEAISKSKRHEAMGKMEFTCFICLSTAQGPQVEEERIEVMSDLENSAHSFHDVVEKNETDVTCDTNQATSPLDIQQDREVLASANETSSNPKRNPSAGVDATGEPLPVFEARKASTSVTLPGSIRFPKEGEIIENIIFADSQGKLVKKRILDPSLRTNFETYRGITIQEFTSKVKREIPLLPIQSIKTITLFMGGNDLAQKEMTIEKFLSILDDAIETLNEKCPNAKVFITEIIPREDIVPDRDMLSLCLEEWAKTRKVGIIYLNISQDGDIYRDGVHLNRNGIRKACYAFKRTFSLPTYIPNGENVQGSSQATNQNKLYHEKQHHRFQRNFSEDNYQNFRFAKRPHGRLQRHRNVHQVQAVPPEIFERECWVRWIASYIV